MAQEYHQRKNQNTDIKCFDSSLSIYASLELIPDAAAFIEPGDRFGICNATWRNYANDNADFASSDWTQWLHPSNRDAIEAVLDSERPDLPFEADIRLRHPQDEYRWFMMRLQAHIIPGADTPLLLCVLTDITIRKQRKQNLAKTINMQAGLLDVTPDCVKVIRPDGTLSYMNKAGCSALGVAHDSGFGMNWLNLLPAEVHEIGKEALDKAMNGSSARFQGISYNADNKAHYWDNMLTPLHTPENLVEAIICVSRDITSQRESEARIKVLLHELNHRSKNQLSVIQALIRRTAPDPTAPFIHTLEQRLSSIAKSQDLLINGDWTGTTLRDLIISQTAIAGDVLNKQILLKGDAILRLATGIAEVMGLALHELTTNAIKYGALSTHTGTVSVDWHLSKSKADDCGQTLHIHWQETGGPEVAAPTRKGLGALVIERNPRVIPGAEVSCSYNPQGFSWSFSAPAEIVLATTEN